MCKTSAPSRMFCLLWLFICFFILSFGQNQIVFNRVFNNYKQIYDSFGVNLYSNDYTYCILPIKSGYIIGGYSENIFWASDSTLLIEAFYLKTNLFGDSIWIRTFNIDSNRIESFADVVEYSDSYYFVGEKEIDSVATDIYYNSLITITDTNGNVLKVQNFNFADNDFIRKIIQYDDKLYFINNIHNYGSNYGTPCLSEIDSNGNIIWSECYSSQFNIGIGYFFVFNNEFYLTGAPDNFSDPFYYSIYKIDLNGHLTDTLHFHNDLGVNINGGAFGNSGFYTDENGLHIIMTGLIELSPNNNAAFVMSVNENGIKEWERIIDEGPKNEMFLSCQVLPDGRIVAISTREDYESNFPLSNNSKTDVCWLTMLDKNGNTIWDRYISAYPELPTYTYPYQVKTALDGGFAITGYVINNSIQSNGIFHRNDAWLCKTDSCGFTTGAQATALLTLDSVVGYTAYLSNLSNNYCTALLYILSYDQASGSLVVLDSINLYAYSQFTNGDDPSQIQYTFADTGTYILRLYSYAGDDISSFSTQVHVRDTTSGLQPEEGIFNLSLSVYPNPANDYFILDADFGHFVNSNKLFEGELRSITGQLLQTFTVNPNLLQQRIFLDELSNGVYFIQIKANGQNLSQERLSVVK